MFALFSSLKNSAVSSKVSPVSRSACQGDISVPFVDI